MRDRRSKKRRLDGDGQRVEKVRPFSQEDEQAFLLKARAMYGYEEWVFWLTLFRTGIRIGEGLALGLADFKLDEEKPRLHLHQTWSTGSGLHRSGRTSRT
jgi:integrase